MNIKKHIAKNLILLSFFSFCFCAKPLPDKVGDMASKIDKSEIMDVLKGLLGKDVAGGVTLENFDPSTHKPEETKVENLLQSIQSDLLDKWGGAVTPEFKVSGVIIQISEAQKMVAAVEKLKALAVTIKAISEMDEAKMKDKTGAVKTQIGKVSAILQGLVS